MKKLNLHKKDTYGIEIEFVTKQTPVLQQEIDDLIAKKKLHPDWILKPEKSCDEYGVEGTGQEINSPVLNYQKSWLLELKQVLHLLEQYTMISSKSAIHFHIGSQIFEGRARYLQDFLLLWCYYEDILYRFATGEYKTIRKATTYYARPMKVSINDYQIQLLTKSLSMWEFLSEFLKGFGKIFAINLSPCYFAMKYQGSDELQWHKDTIEARIFSTTYDYSFIYAYLDMLLATIEKARKWFDWENTLSSNPESMFIRTDNVLRQINFSQILYVSGLKDYITIYLMDEKHPIITHLTMKSMEEMLPSDRFMRIHRSYIVALDKIRAVDRNNCVYIGNEVIRVTDAYKDAFSAFLERSMPK